MPDALPLVTLYLSERCNSRCISCDYWRHGRRDLSLESVRRMLPELEALGTRDVLLSGGEPLLNPEWRKIALALRSSGFELWLLTSGLSLAKHAREAAALFGSVTVSLDGTTAETYARIRGIDAFDKVCEGVSAAAGAGVPTSLRVTLQRSNFRELPRFVSLARRLGACRLSFLAVDVANPHAFARRDAVAPRLGLDAGEVEEFGRLLAEFERSHASEFANRFIAESPAKLRRIRDYFSALLGLGPFPPTRCNAPEFSAVVTADGRISPCFFIEGPAAVPRAPALGAALDSSPMRELRARIRAGQRPECERCVCSMWREPKALEQQNFRLRSREHA